MNRHRTIEALTNAISVVVGVSVSHCDATRGPSRDDRFALEGVPEGTRLDSVAEAIAQHYGLSVVHAPDANPDQYRGTLLAGGRTRVPYSSVTLSRIGNLVLGDVVVL